MSYPACVLGLLVTVVLAAPNVVARVQDGETRQAVAGAMVVSEGSDIMAATDSSGQCLVVAVPKKGRTIRASRTGYLDARLVWLPRAKPVPDTVWVDMLLYPDRPRVVVGRVLDAGTKLGIAGATVSVVGAELAESTQADGGFLFSRFPPGLQNLEASFAGYPSRSFPVEVKGGETTSVELYLLDTTNVGTVEGTVFDASTGRSVPGARVVVEGTGCEALSDSAGRYSIAGVPVGTNRLLVTGDGYLRAYTMVKLVKDWAVTVDLYLRKTAAPAPGR